MTTPSPTDQPAQQRPLVELAAVPPAPSFDGTQLCAQVDPELFFPEKGRMPKAAKQLCAACEFLNPCRRYAMNARINGDDILGIWGGTSAADRRWLRRATAAGRLDVDVDVDEDLDDVELDEDVAS